MRLMRRRSDGKVLRTWEKPPGPGRSEGDPRGFQTEPGSQDEHVVDLPGLTQEEFWRLAAGRIGGSEAFHVGEVLVDAGGAILEVRPPAQAPIGGLLGELEEIRQERGKKPSEPLLWGDVELAVSKRRQRSK